jgi:hypothetical protein
MSGPVIKRPASPPTTPLPGGSREGATLAGPHHPSAPAVGQTALMALAGLLGREAARQWLRSSLADPTPDPSVNPAQEPPR